MKADIDAINREFYNASGDTFDALPFKEELPALLINHLKGPNVLEIGSGPGALAIWLTEQGYTVTCIEPAETLAKSARKKGLEVHCTTFQNFTPTQKYDSIVAISSLIHIPKREFLAQIEKISRILNPGGALILSLIEGDGEGLDDPTKTGRTRFFSKWQQDAIHLLLSPYFRMIENKSIYNQAMGYTFLLQAYSASS